MSSKFTGCGGPDATDWTGCRIMERGIGAMFDACIVVSITLVDGVALRGRNPRSIRRRARMYAAAMSKAYSRRVVLLA